MSTTHRVADFENHYETNVRQAYIEVGKIQGDLAVYAYRQKRVSSSEKGKALTKKKEDLEKEISTANGFIDTLNSLDSEGQKCDAMQGSDEKKQKKVEMENDRQDLGKKIQKANLKHFGRPREPKRSD